MISVVATEETVRYRDRRRRRTPMGATTGEGNHLNVFIQHVPQAQREAHWDEVSPLAAADTVPFPLSSTSCEKTRRQGDGSMPAQNVVCRVAQLGILCTISLGLVSSVRSVSAFQSGLLVAAAPLSHDHILNPGADDFFGVHESPATTTLPTREPALGFTTLRRRWGLTRLRAAVVAAPLDPSMGDHRPSSSSRFTSNVPTVSTHDLSSHERVRNNRWLQFVFSKRKLALERAYAKRKEEWAIRYTSVDGLRDSFGSNRNPIWGDLDAPTARRLYKTLLPKALLELYDFGVHAEDLAPLAYRARVAAKKYARERSILPARAAASLYDGFRQWKKYGSFNTSGMSYQQIWEKYAAVILEECKDLSDMTTEDVTAKVCLKILERSCETNEMIDRMVMSDHSLEEKRDLLHITRKLEEDVRLLLQPYSRSGGGNEKSVSGGSLTDRHFADNVHEDRNAIINSSDYGKRGVNDECCRDRQLSLQKFRTLRAVVRIKRRLERMHTTVGTATARFLE